MATDSRQNQARSRRYPLYRWVVWPRLQIQFLFLMIAQSSIVLFAGFIAQGVFRRRLIHAAEILGLSENHPYFKFIEHQATWLNQVSFSTFLLSLIPISIVSLYFSYRIAGPIRRLKRTLDEYSRDPNSIWQPLVFRKGDPFFDLAASVNTALEKNEKRSRNQTDEYDFVAVAHACNDDPRKLRIWRERAQQRDRATHGLL